MHVVHQLMLLEEELLVMTVRSMIPWTGIGRAEIVPEHHPEPVTPAEAGQPFAT